MKHVIAVFVIAIIVSLVVAAMIHTSTWTVMNERFSEEMHNGYSQD